MPRYENTLTTEAMRDLVILQIGKAMYNLQPDRPIFRTYRDLPSVGSKYLLLESGTVTTKGTSSYGSEVYYNAIDDNFLEDTVIKQQQVFTITAASDDPELILKRFVNKRYSTNFWWEFFSQFDIGINTISDITDTSVPVDGGDWEERYSFSLTINYLSKETEIVDTIETITGSISVDSGDIVLPLNSELSP